jgi:hypothetical protein
MQEKGRNVVKKPYSNINKNKKDMTSFEKNENIMQLVGEILLTE